VLGTEWAADELGDVAQCRHEIVARLEAGVSFLDAAAAFDIDIERPVDHDLADGLVLEELSHRGQKTEQRLLEYLAWDHGAFSLRWSHARASAACSPSGASSR